MIDLKDIKFIVTISPSPVAVHHLGLILERFFSSFTRWCGKGFPDSVYRSLIPDSSVFECKLSKVPATRSLRCKLDTRGPHGKRVGQLFPMLAKPMSANGLQISISVVGLSRSLMDPKTHYIARRYWCLVMVPAPGLEPGTSRSTI